MKKHETKLRVRYGETDQMGVVYHGNYAQYLEVARVEWLRSIDISYKKMEADGVMLPVVNLNINFKKPAFYDEVIIIKTKLRKKPGLKITIDQEIYNNEDVLLTISEITLVFVSMQTKRPILCPDELLKKLGF
ncbi:MAG: acyl-CoA thioesterase [Flavobacteriaceae bacterium]|nr:acyl-CoA thioesterase [Flavobacteriaceae bacterium]